MKYLFFLITLFLISFVQADIISIGATGGDEIVLGYGNQIETFFSGIDEISPVVEIIYPTNNLIIENVLESYNIIVNYSITEDNLDSCWYSLTGVQTINTTLSCSVGYNFFILTITNFGDLTLNIYSNDTLGNYGSDSSNFSIIEYTGARSGGGSSVQPSERFTLDYLKYNQTVMCQEIKNFLYFYGNYTEKNVEDLKNNLAISLGFAVEDYILESYLTNFPANCPEFIDIPPLETYILEEKNNVWIYVIILTILMISIVAFLVNKRKTIVLNKHLIDKLDNLMNKIKNKIK